MESDVFDDVSGYDEEYGLAMYENKSERIMTTEINQSPEKNDQIIEKMLIPKNDIRDDFEFSSG